MYIFYNTKTDYLEILRTKAPNYGEQLKKGVTIFHAEKDSKEIGFGLENASKKIESFNLLTPFEKFSVL